MSKINYCLIGEVNCASLKLHDVVCSTLHQRMYLKRGHFERLNFLKYIGTLNSIYYLRIADKGFPNAYPIQKKIQFL